MKTTVKNYHLWQMAKSSHLSTDNFINELLEKACDQLKREGKIDSLFWIVSEDDSLYSFPSEISDDPMEKLRQSIELKALARRYKAKEVFRIADSFVSPLDGSRPSLHLHRREAIMLYHEDSEGNSVTIQEYTRLNRNRIKFGKKKVITNVEGIFSGFLSD